jgi:SSS family solute:Na+ symporter
MTAAFVVYLVALMGIGLFSSRTAGEDIDEFFLGGRRLNALVVALSAVVSGRSSWLVLGVTGAAFHAGLPAVWVLPGYILAELMMFVLVAPRLRRYTERRDCLTLPDFFEARFGDHSRRLRVVSVVLILVFFTAYIGAQLTAGTKTFQAVFGLPALESTVLVTVIVALYTISGGFLAVSLTDAVQAVLMLLGLVVMPVLATYEMGGPGALLQQLEAISTPRADLLAMGTLAGVLKGLAIGTGSFGQPHILSRYMAIDDAEKLRAAALVGTVWNVLMGWGAIAIGLVGRAVYREASALPLGDVETLFVRMAVDTFPGVVVGLLVSAVVAAIQSTVDSQLLVAASGAARDLYQKMTDRGREAGPEELVWVSRACVLGVLAVAFGIGVYASQSDDPVFQSVFRFVLQAWYGLGCAFGPLILLGLLWRGVSASGALAGMVVGPTCVLLGLVSNGYQDWIGAWATWARPELVGFFGALAAIVVVSLERPPDDEVRAELDLTRR